MYVRARVYTCVVHIYTNTYRYLFSDVSEQKMLFLALLDLVTEQVWDSIGTDSRRLCEHQSVGTFSLSYQTQLKSQLGICLIFFSFPVGLYLTECKFA